MTILRPATRLIPSLAFVFGFLHGSDVAAQTVATGTMMASRDPAPVAETRDSLKNGIVTGAVIGAAGGLVPAVVYSTMECCWNPPSRSAFIARSTVIGAGIGAGIGAAVDALRGVRPRTRSQHRVSVVPTIAHDRKGVTAALVW